MPKVLPVTVPGVVKHAWTALELDAGDSLTVGQLGTPEVSPGGTVAVSELALNAAPIVDGFLEFAAGTAVVYKLTLTQGGSLPTEGHIIFPYSTNGGDQRRIKQPLQFFDAFATQSGGSLGFTGGGLLLLAAAPPAPLWPAKYVIDASGGSFVMELQEAPGEWLVLDPLHTAAINNVTIGTALQTFNGEAGPLVLDWATAAVRILNLDGGSDFEVIVQ